MALPWISGKVLEIFNLPEMAFLTARVFWDLTLYCVRTFLTFWGIVVPSSSWSNSPRMSGTVLSWRWVQYYPLEC
jgi:hypothetical protein